MNNSISPDMEKRIRALCDEIASAESLDADLRDELYTHIEDKILAYLDGEETLSEADAFLLAREHFGDRVAVREELWEVHIVESEFRFFRHLLISGILAIGLGILFMIVSLVFTFALLTSLVGEFLAVEHLVMLFRVSLFSMYLVLLFSILRTWIRGSMKGEPIWHQRWSMIQLSIVFVTMVGIQMSVNLLYAVLVISNLDLLDTVSGPRMSQSFHLTISVLFTVCVVAILFMWFDVFRKPRNGVLFGVVLAYTMFQILSTILASLVYVTPRTVPDLRAGQVYVNYVQGPVLLELESVQLVLNTQLAFSWILQISMKYTFVPAILTWLVYIVWARYRNRGGKTSDLVVARR